MPENGDALFRCERGGTPMFVRDVIIICSANKAATIVILLAAKLLIVREDSSSSSEASANTVQASLLSRQDEARQPEQWRLSPERSSSGKLTIDSIHQSLLT